MEEGKNFIFLLAVKNPITNKADDAADGQDRPDHIILPFGNFHDFGPVEAVGPDFGDNAGDAGEKQDGSDKYEQRNECAFHFFISVKNPISLYYNAIIDGVKKN
jgi:hypothetical protein